MNKTVSVRWLVAVVAGVVVGMFALTGTAAAPPAGAPVRIVDADNASLAAHVDANGNLQVGGTVGIDPAQNSVSVDSSTPINVAVDSSTPVSVTTDDDPGRQAFEFAGTAFFSTNAATVVFTVPDGKRLVIEYASFSANLPIGQSVQTFRVATPLSHFLVPTFTGTSALGNDDFVAGQDVRLYADGGTTVVLDAHRDAVSGSATFYGAVSGHLIDCSVAPCN